jgi:FAD dependent oxidoreductase TIGR03364
VFNQKLEISNFVISLTFANMNHFDLIIVGSGVLGTFHAYNAAKLGKEVLLIEKDQYPIQATVRNFGQVVPSGMGKEWFDLGVRSTEFYKNIQSEFDISVRNNSSVYIASDADEQQLIHELKNEMDSRGYGAELLTPAQCLSKWPTLKKEYCLEGLFFPQEVSVEPEKMIHRLITYCTTKFSNLIYKSSTTIIDCFVSGNIVKIVSNTKEKFTSDKVIICNGGEFKLLFPDLFRSSGIVVSKLQMLRTVPMPQVELEGNILTGLTIRRYESFQECPSYHHIETPENLSELKKWGIHILFKKATDGSFIIGDSHEYADVNHTDDLGFAQNEYINQLMLKEAQRIVRFDVTKIAATWSGYYPQHNEKGIVEIDLEDKIHIRTAIGGKGMTTSAGYAEQSIKKLI